MPCRPYQGQLKPLASPNHHVSRLQGFLQPGVLLVTHFFSSPPYLLHSVLSSQCSVMSPLGSAPSVSFPDAQFSAVPLCFPGIHGISLLQDLLHECVIVYWFVLSLPIPIKPGTVICHGIPWLGYNRHLVNIYWVLKYEQSYNNGNLLDVLRVNN